MTMVNTASHRKVSDEAQATLKRLLAQMSEANPHLEFVCDGGVVWMRWRETGIDYGLYSVILTGEVLQCYDFDTRITVVTRKIPESEVAA